MIVEQRVQSGQALKIVVHAFRRPINGRIGDTSPWGSMWREITEGGVMRGRQGQQEQEILSLPAGRSRRRDFSTTKAQPLALLHHGCLLFATFGRAFPEALVDLP